MNLWVAGALTKGSDRCCSPPRQSKGSGESCRLRKKLASAPHSIAANHQPSKGQTHNQEKRHPPHASTSQTPLRTPPNSCLAVTLPCIVYRGGASQISRFLPLVTVAQSGLTKNSKEPVSRGCCW
ncbi:hypothetical protein MCOR27_011801 [Pyricularia oryzae]|nr:hypothetical protein MCOR27_011801 [Pyricularia oryzae]KAI6616028.1 hypothetical protein MCOR07_011851 [Pyricularia oryzae]